MPNPRKQHQVVDGVEQKHCPLCDSWLDLSMFHKGSGWDGKQSICATCKRARRKKAPRSYITARHGLSETQYENLLSEQGNRCAICGSADSGGKAWHIDHNHECCHGAYSCGRCVRGLLCVKCNVGLGAFKDSISTLSNAIEYLRGTNVRLY